MASQKPEAEDRSASASEAPDEEAVRQRAYEISQREDAGTDDENWARAERELREEQTEAQGPFEAVVRDAESGGHDTGALPSGDTDAKLHESETNADIGKDEHDDEDEQHAVAVPPTNGGGFLTLTSYPGAAVFMDINYSF